MLTRHDVAIHFVYFLAAPPAFKCKYFEWQCPGSFRVCINRTQVCDGNNDCPHGDDESDTCNQDTCYPDRAGCSHSCRMTPFGATCFCPAGLSRNGSRTTCVDVDECADVSSCSHFCENTIGSFKCTCDTGYNLMPNKRTCKVQSMAPVVPYATP